MPVACEHVRRPGKRVSIWCFMGAFQVRRNFFHFTVCGGEPGRKKAAGLLRLSGEAEFGLEHGLDGFSFVGKFLERLVDLLA